MTVKSRASSHHFRHFNYHLLIRSSVQLREFSHTNAEVLRYPDSSHRKVDANSVDTPAPTLDQSELVHATSRLPWLVTRRSTQ